MSTTTLKNFGKHPGDFALLVCSTGYPKWIHNTHWHANNGVGQLTIIGFKDSQQRKYLSCTAELETLVNCNNQNLFGDQN